MQQILISSWIVGDNCCLAELMKVPDISSVENSLKVSEFILPSKAWDIAKLQGLVNQTCIRVILTTPLLTNPIPDSIFWGLCRSGEFSTKTTTWAAHQLDLHKFQS